MPVSPTIGTDPVKVPATLMHSTHEHTWLVNYLHLHLHTCSTQNYRLFGQGHAGHDDCEGQVSSWPPPPVPHQQAGVLPNTATQTDGTLFQDTTTASRLGARSTCVYVMVAFILALGTV